MTALAHHTDYRQGLEDIKRRIQSAQTRAVLAANTELLQLYWDIGRQLAQWCWRRFKIEPPCRLNFEPGLMANL